jgi:peptidoglycan-associated lipoprotein
MLQDGLDAAADHAPGAARNLLEELISAYPHSPEAARARKVLAHLDPTSEAAYESSVIKADEDERLKGFRHAFLLETGDRVFFSENSAAIGGRARVMIENQARWLKARQSLQVDIIGRSDDGGSPEAERSLARQRAEATRDRLVEAGVDAGRLRIKVLGGGDPLAICRSPLCQAENRNVEIFISALNSDGDATTGPAASADRPSGHGTAQAGLGVVSQ